MIGEAVVTNALDMGDAAAGIKAVEAWLKAISEEVTMWVVGDLKAEVARLKGEIRGKPPLRSA